MTDAAVTELVSARVGRQPDERFVRACLEVTGGNPFLLGELLDEAGARDLQPTATAAEEVASIVPRGVANAVLLRRSEEHTSELQSLRHLVCRLLLEKKK